MKGLNTKMLHGYPVIDGYTGAASIPKYQTSTFDQKSCYVDRKKYSYSRFGNPTVMALESAVAKLEGAKHALVFSSGMAAISNVLMLAGAGGHLPKRGVWRYLPVCYRGYAKAEYGSFFP